MGRNARKGLTKQEMEFLSHYIVCGGGAEAVRRTSGLDVNSPRIWASRCLKRPDVQVELKNLRDGLHRETMLTIEQQLERYEQHIADAKKDRAHSAVVKAEDSMAKIRGHLVDKKQVAHTMTDDRSIDEKKAEIRELIQELGLTPALPAPNGQIVDAEFTVDERE